MLLNLRGQAMKSTYTLRIRVKIPIAESPYRGLRPAYEEALAEGIILGACGYCASPPHLNVKDKLPKNIRLIGDEHHHYAFTDLVDQGFQIILS